MYFPCVGNYINLLKCKVAVESFPLFLPCDPRSAPLAVLLSPALPQGAPLCVTAVQTLKKGRRAYGVDTQGLAERETRGAALIRPRGEGHISPKSSDVCVYPGSDRSTSSVCGEGQANLTMTAYLADAHSHIATAAADISVKWIELFASLLNVRKYQTVSIVFCKFCRLAQFSLSLSQPLLHPSPLTVSFFILNLLIEFYSFGFLFWHNNVWITICVHAMEKIHFFPALPTHTKHRQIHCTFDIETTKVQYDLIGFFLSLTLHYFSQFCLLPPVAHCKKAHERLSFWAEKSPFNPPSSHLHLSHPLSPVITGL